jgi:hypothetical protein
MESPSVSVEREVLNVMAGMDVAPATARTTWSQARKFDLQLQLEIDLKAARTLTQMARARAPLFTLPMPGFAGFFTNWNGRPSPTGCAMKILSIRQPWASLIVAGVKDVENRTWPMRYRGRVLIHSSLRADDTAAKILNVVSASVCLPSRRSAASWV